jgi:hypothetical protein
MKPRIISWPLFTLRWSETCTSYDDRRTRMTFRCGRCTQPMQARNAAPGRAVTCPRCRHVNICPSPARSSSPSQPAVQTESRGLPVGATAAVLAVVALVVAAWTAWGQLSGPDLSATEIPPEPAAALQQELLQKNIDTPGDPDLNAKYQAINARHFAGALPVIRVIWEPGLTRLSEISGHAFTLQGMFGHVGKRSLILLNTDLKTDEAALGRALCHEMVHAYFHSIGDTTTDHGPGFQGELQRLSSEGAFEGLVATDADRARLRAWLDGESRRLEVERQELERLGAEIQRERAEIENSGGDAARRDAYNQRAIDGNARADRHRRDLEHFNDEVSRYNLMLVYPDGIDEQSLIRQRTPGR